MIKNYRNLREFIEILKATGELRVIKTPVSPRLEMSRLIDAESKSPGGGRALLFEKVEGSPFPVAANLFGSHKRIRLALGVRDLDEPGDRIRALIRTKPPQGLGDMLGLLPTVLGVGRWFPKRSRAKVAPCQEVVALGDEVDLSRLPVPLCWPRDAGPFITLPLVFTKSLSSGRRNLGMYRLQVFDRNTTGMHWHIHKDGSHFFQEYRQAGKKMPVAVAIGADPAVIYAATAPLPRDVDELLLAGFLRQKPVTMTKCLTVDLEVPAEAEFVLEGYVDPGESRLEGPFGDHTGYYSLADYYPVFRVTALTRRRDPVYCATLVGPPPMEDCYLGLATERIFLPLLQAAVPEIVDLLLPWEGVFHNLAVVSIKKDYPGQAQKVMFGLWGQGQMSFCKAILVVDADVDLKKPAEVLTRLLERIDLSVDLTLAQGVLDVLDHSSPTAIFGAKLGIDLTEKMAGEPKRRYRIASQPLSDERAAGVGEAAAKAWPGPVDVRVVSVPGVGEKVLLVSADKGGKSGRDLAGALSASPDLREFGIMITLDRDVDLSDGSRVLWKLLNNVDPGRHFHWDRTRLVIDAGQKGPADGHFREWPEELRFDPA
ncbi:MAG: menaquinone biosynthesis decarboxylase [Pseudomonadota bacterium]